MSSSRTSSRGPSRPDSQWPRTSPNGPGSRTAPASASGGQLGWARAVRYAGRSDTTSCPRAASPRARPATASPSPPLCASGASSLVAKKTRIGPLDVELVALAEVRARHHDHAALRDREALAVALQVVADDFAGGDPHALVDDAAAQLRAAAHVDEREEHALLDVAVAVHAHAVEADRALEGAARDDRARADDRVDRLAHTALGLVAEHELARARRRLRAADGPQVVVQVEPRVD